VRTTPQGTAWISITLISMTRNRYCKIKVDGKLRSLMALEIVIKVGMVCGMRTG